jgi:protein-tyrosine phosphatase
MTSIQSENVVNFRDAGAFVNLIACRAFLAEGRLFRGGTIQALANMDAIGSPATILSLKNSPNADREGVCMLHHPRPNTAECYQTDLPPVRAWIRGILCSLAQPPAQLPLYIHCHSGRDRTGVVVAALLKIADVPDDIIIEEYMLSDGADLPKIQRALAGLQHIEQKYPQHHILMLRSLLVI